MFNSKEKLVSSVKVLLQSNTFNFFFCYFPSKNNLKLEKCDCIMYVNVLYNDNISSFKMSNCLTYAHKHSHKHSHTHVYLNNKRTKSKI